MGTWVLRRYMSPSYPMWDDLQPIMLENEVASTPRLQRKGVKLENEIFAPVVREGDFYNTSPGDDFTARIRIEQRVVTQDGSTVEIVREAVDTGRAAPEFVQSVDSSISDEERAAGDAIREQWNQQVFEQNLINNYTAPYTPPPEYTPDSGYYAADPGYVESEPIAVPQGTYTPPSSYAPDTQQVQQVANDGIGAVVTVGGWVEDIITAQAQDDYIAYLNALEQAESEAAYGWGGGGV